MCEIWLLFLNGLPQCSSKKYWKQFYLLSSGVMRLICHPCAQGIRERLPVSGKWNCRLPLKKRAQFHLIVISQAKQMLSWSTHRQPLFHFPSLEFCLCCFPLVEMKGQIAIWNPYVKNNNYSFYFYYWYHLEKTFLIDRDESARGSVTFPYLSVQEKAIFLGWLKSSIS